MALIPDPTRAATEAFAQCPACGLVAPPDPADYQQPAGSSVAVDAVDWTRPVQVRCPYCGQGHQVTTATLPLLDEVATCPHCAGHTPCPGAALRVDCRSCGASYPGPNVGGLDGEQHRRRRRELRDGYDEVDDQLWQ